MRTRSTLLRIAVAAGIILSFSSMTFAAQQFSIKKNATVKKTGPVVAQLPDLSFLKKVQWSNFPKAGDTIGSAAILNIPIKNKGIAASKPCKMQIRFSSIKGGSFLPSLSGTLHIPPLNPGQTYALSWPQLSSDKWPAGKFQFTFTIDPMNQVAESVETNNKDQLRFDVAALPKKFTLKKKAAANTVVQAAKPAASLSADLKGLSILSPKANTLLMAPRTYTIRYLATGVEKIDLDYLIYEVDYQGNPKDTFVTRRLVKDQAPTGAYDVQINSSMVPFRHSSGAGTPLSGSTERFDGKVAIRLSAVVNGKKVERICPLRVKCPRIRLVQPESGSNLYRGLWYEARWSTIGHRLEKVKLHITKKPPSKKWGFSSIWTVEVPNTGKYRFRVPPDLEMPSHGPTVSLVVEERFDLNLWNPRVFGFKNLVLH